MKSHSERIPGKNIKKLNGKPLFFYIADTLRSTNLFEVLVINTDSQEIEKLAKERYFDWVKINVRPSHLCGDYVSMNSIIEYDVNCFGIENDFFQTHSTNPLLTKETINHSVDLYYMNRREEIADSLFSVNKIKTRLYDGNTIPINHSPERLERTQDLQEIYEENSNIYIFSGASFMSNNHRIAEKAYMFLMERNAYEGIDIDEQEDWALAELLVNGVGL